MVSIPLVVSAAGLQAAEGELTLERVLDPERVIDVSIDIPAEDWAALCKQTRDPAKAFSGVLENPFTWFRGDVTVDGVTIRSVGIRKKGFMGSLDDQFPSLKIDFDEYVRQSPIPGAESLTLNNNKQDTSLASQFLTYALFNAAGVPAPRCAFSRVTVNGNYLGVYTNVESIGKPFLQRRFGNSAGNLYEGTIADFYPKAIDRLDVKTNRRNHDRSQADRLAQLLAAPGPLAIDEVARLVDLDSFLRFWAVESLIGFWDGYTNNQNNYWVYANGADGKFYFLPWGADMAFMPAGPFPGFGAGGPISVYAESMLANRLIHDAATADRYRETMRWVLANAWKEDEMLQTVDRIEGLVTPHLHRRQSGAPRAMKTTRDFIRNRRAKIEKELDNWPVRVAEQPRKPTYSVEIGTTRGTFSATWVERPPANVAETGSAALDMKLSEGPVAFRQSGASAYRPRQGMPFGFGRRPADTPPVVHIVITAIRESDGKPVTLTLPVDPRETAQSIGKPVAISGSYAIGGERRGGFFMPFSPQTVNGNLTLSKAEFQADGMVEGSFELTIFEARGGFMDRRPPARKDPGAAPSSPTKNDAGDTPPARNE